MPFRHLFAIRYSGLVRSHRPAKRRGPSRSPRPPSVAEAQEGRATPPPSRPQPRHLRGAIEQLDRELPGLIRQAVARVKKGKPPTLLRVLRGLLRDLGDYAEAPATPAELCPVCHTTDWEHAILEGVLKLMRRGHGLAALPHGADHLDPGAEQVGASPNVTGPPLPEPNLTGSDPLTPNKD